MIEQLAEMPTYEAYKDSGVEWIGEIPAHWDSTSCKRLLEMPITDGPHSTPQLFDNGVPFISAEAIKNGVINFDSKRGYISEKDYKEFSKKYVPRRNDIYMVKSGATTGRVAKVETDEKFAIWSPLAVFRSKKSILQNGFLYYFLSSPPFQKGIELSWSFGTQQNIGMGVLGNLPVCYPPLSEQTAIAAFLDCKTTQIDQALAIKEQQIALLKEHKQILIQTAVTRGLDPNVPIRDSGIEWIGEIPAHWELHRLKRFAQINPSIGRLDKKSSDLICFLPMENVRTDGVVDYSNKQEIRMVSQGFTQFKKGDVIMAKITPCFENGKSAHLKFMDSDIGFGSTEFHVLRAKSNLLPEYLYYAINTNTFFQMGEALMTGSAGQKRVPTSFVANYILGLPSLVEQENIVSHIETQSAKIELAIAIQQQQIDKLKEYKTTLINSAVTGKIHVPEVVI